MKRSRPPKQWGVIRWIAEVNGAFGLRWRVFTTTDDRYLFSCVQNPDLWRVVRRSELTPDMREALSHGWGHARTPGGPR